MTLEMTPSHRGGRPEYHSSGASYHLVIDDIERYRVLADGRTIGYIDVVGSVFVALVGPHYALAIEVRQSLVLEDAAHAVVNADREVWSGH
ncbi:hypothetical protein ITJ43_08240 [Microbacterium sp. VKM Ac-2870]|uniref:hypothetical protein n=1 Tax=Microbacterium sp. VKM Ac-2870 TaxID=2783825 RepID=UPI00188C367E|nr:hypothetical protein [Microbacterium sp. VKM Ac-2870]MBF4562130.1 hypothetical protein [Microbacterium sp. VKM Ac-2870]